MRHNIVAHIIPQRVLSLLARETLLLGMAVIATYLISAYIASWYVGTQLSSGVEQTGWPFAYWMKTWVEWNNKGFERPTFNFFFFACDVLIFYNAIHFVMFMVKRILTLNMNSHKPIDFQNVKNEITRNSTI